MSLDDIRARWAEGSSRPWRRYSIDSRAGRSHSVKAKSGMVVAQVGCGVDGGGAYVDAEQAQYPCDTVRAITEALQ